MEIAHITRVDQWTALWESGAPVLLLKHSTRCPVSTAAHEEFEAYVRTGRTDVQYAIVLVVEHRDVSDRIAADTGVKHESPQAIYVVDREKYWSASHWAVTKRHIHAVLDDETHTG
ncbi:MAG: bacillithiol system redox-active protein YtxJ [Paenibacillaceae bacterium]|jgi:bacillithiol system protein YtxJ|nr:bacillithiol system redox-active protein YtxJ [Paenibacillaceae bacterium]